MDAHPENAEKASPAPPDADELLYLIGRPKLRQYLRFMRDNAIDPPGEEDLAREWQEAHRHVVELAAREAGAADGQKPSAISPDSKYRPLLIELLKDPLIRNGFNAVPTEVAFVELDRMVVYQKHIDLAFVRELQRRLGPSPGDEEVFRSCLPFMHPHPPARWSRLDDDSFVFVSRSNDLRFLGAMPLNPGHVRGIPHPGSLVGVVGLAVGYGSNFLNAVCCEGRLVLNNGSHRAYALRELGLTHVPCIVQHVSSRDELDLVGSAELRRDPDQYLKNPRPSMLKDYFTPGLRRVTPARRQCREIRIRFSVSECYVPVI